MFSGPNLTGMLRYDKRVKRLYETFEVMTRDNMKCNGMGWEGIGRDRMECNRMVLDVMVWDGRR